MTMHSMIRKLTALAVTLAVAGCAALPRGMTDTASVLPAHGTFIATLSSAETYQPGRAASESLVLRRPLTLQTGIVEDPAFVDFCNQIVDRLLASWPYARPNVQVLLVPSTSFTSDTTPEGAIIVSTGLLHYLSTHPAPDNGDRLAFVLAHELSHVLMGQTTSRAALFKNAAKLRGIVYAGAAITLGAKAAVIADATKSAVVADYLFGVATTNGVFPAWQRDQESMADLLAIDLMAKAGYNLQGATDILTILIAQERKAAAAEPAILPFQHYVTTHAVGNQTEINFGFGQALKPYFVRAENAVLAGHPAAIDRLKIAATYITRQYPTYLPPMSDAGFTHIIDTAPTRLMIENEVSLGDAAVSLEHRQAMEAASQLRSIKSIVLRQSEYYLFLQAETDFELGRSDQAAAYLTDAERQKLETQPVMVLRAQLLLNAHHYNAAQAAFGAADAKFATQAYLPQRIQIDKLQGKTLIATKLMFECNASGKMNLIGECEHADQ